MKGIFVLVEEYLDRLDADFHQKHFQTLLEENLDKLRVVLSSQETFADRITQVDDEFQKIQKVLKEKLEFERISLERAIDDSEGRLRRGMSSTREKAVMVILPEKMNQ